MSITAYVGDTLQQQVPLRIDAGIAESLSGSQPTEWQAPTKYQLVDPNGTVWAEGLIENPPPRVIGSDYIYDYLVDFVIPDTLPGTYSLVVRRYTVSTSLSVTIEGVARDSYGAESVLCLLSDTGVKWSLLDENPNANVNWSLSYRRVDGTDTTLTNTTDVIHTGSDTLYVSAYELSPMVEGFSASLNPHTIIWDIQDNASIALSTRKQTSSLFIINVSILTAITELKGFFDRLNQEARLPSLEYSSADYCLWLKQGMDMFNAGGLFTQFTMINATGAIRHWWFICSIISALRNMYILEGQRAFSFSGQSVTLDVDMTQYIQSLLSDLQGQWDSEKLTFKQQLKQYGLVSGDGNMNNAKFQVGALGLTMNPASNFGGFWSSRNIQGPFRFY